MDLSSCRSASADAPASILAARKAQEVEKSTAEELLATVRPPAKQDSAAISAEAQALLDAEERATQRAAEDRPADGG